MLYDLRVSRWNAKVRRVLAKSQLVLRRIAKTRTVGAVAELGKALRADVADLGEHLSRRAADNLARLDWKQEASRTAARFRSKHGCPMPPASTCYFSLHHWRGRLSGRSAIFHSRKS